MLTYDITFKVKVDASVNYDAVMEWVRYQLGETGHIIASNPLIDTEIEAEYNSVTMSSGK